MRHSDAQNQRKGTGTGMKINTRRQLIPRNSVPILPRMMVTRSKSFLCVISLAFAISFLLALGASQGMARPLPKPDFYHLHTYIHDLQRSSLPAAHAFLRQIAHGPRDLARERAAARREGIPTELKQLEKPAHPPSEDAAPLFAALRRLLKIKPLGLPRYAQPLIGGYDYTPEQLTVVRNLFNSRPDVISLLHRAADKPYCNFIRPPGLDPTIQLSYALPQFATMREAERLLRTESYLLARSGRYSEAVSNETRGFRVAQHAASEVNLDGYLPALFFQGIAMSSMNDILHLAGEKKDVARQVERAVILHSPHLSLRNSLASHLPVYLYFLRSARTSGQKSVSEFLVDEENWADQTERKEIPQEHLSASDLRFVHNLFEAQAADFIRRMRLVIRATHDKPDPRLHILFARIARRDPDNPVDVAAPFLLPLLSSLAELSNRAYAEEAVTIVAAEALQRRTKTGAFPSRLPTPMMDPFNGKQLGYRREGSNVFMVFSAGPDAAYLRSRLWYDPVIKPPFFRYPERKLGPVKVK